jgi:hypothetical protein
MEKKEYKIKPVHIVKLNKYYEKIIKKDKNATINK